MEDQTLKDNLNIIFDNLLSMINTDADVQGIASKSSMGASALYHPTTYPVNQENLFPKQTNSNQPIAHLLAMGYQEVCGIAPAPVNSLLPNRFINNHGHNMMFNQPKLETVTAASNDAMHFYSGTGRVQDNVCVPPQHGGSNRINTYDHKYGQPNAAIYHSRPNQSNNFFNRFQSHTKPSMPKGTQSMTTSGRSPEHRFRQPRLQTKSFAVTLTGYHQENDGEITVAKPSYINGNRQKERSIRQNTKDRLKEIEAEYVGYDVNIESFGIGPKCVIKSVEIKLLQKFEVTYDYLGELATQRADNHIRIVYKPKLYGNAVRLQWLWEHLYKHANEERTQVTKVIAALKEMCELQKVDRMSFTFEAPMNFQLALNQFLQSNRYQILNFPISECSNQNEANSLIELLDGVAKAVRKCSTTIWALRTLLEFSKDPERPRVVTPTELHDFDDEATESRSRNIG